MAKINALIDSLWVLWDWVVWILHFLSNALATILSSIWNWLNRIFDWTLFNLLNWVINSLAFYIWTWTAQVLVWLFCLVFLLLFVSFLFRFLKGEIKYVLTWRVHKRL